MTGRLNGKVALVTGSARGMGEGFARRFAAEGARVVVTDVLDDDGERVAAEIGDAACYMHLDVTSEAEWASTIAQVVDTFGGLHVLVNNAGVSRRVPLPDLDLAWFDRTLKINLYGTFLGMREVARPMEASGGGSIINIASSATKRATPGGAAYAASKWGVTGLTKVAALDLGPLGIRVNSVHPGATDTPLLKEIQEAMRREGRQMRSHRVGTKDELANVVLFLASDESSYVNGAEHVVDGGHSI